MASTKIPVKDILAAIDMGAKNVWDEMNDDERKSVSFWLLNRYAASVKGSDAEIAVLKTNEFYNKHYMTMSKHPKLMWMLLCMSASYDKIKYHEWIGMSSKKDKLKQQEGKFLSVLEKVYPTHKMDELIMLAKMSTKEEIKDLAENYGIEIKF